MFSPCEYTLAVRERDMDRETPRDFLPARHAIVSVEIGEFRESLRTRAANRMKSGPDVAPIEAIRECGIESVRDQL